MLKNYFKIAWRNISKHRFYAVVNIVGLLTGLTFTLLISAYVWQELQVNKKLKNSGQQYILTTVSTDPNVGYELATFGPVAKRLKEDYPNLVSNYYRWDGITSVVSKNDKHFREGLQVGDSTLLKMYGLELLHGDVNTALLNPYSVVITGEKAVKYFGKLNVVGETINIQSFLGGKHEFTVTGVLKEVTENSVTHLVDDYPNSFFIPVNTLSFFGRMELDSWNNMFVVSYIQLKDGVVIKDLEKPIRQLMEQNLDATLRKVITVKPVLLSDYHLRKDQGVVKRMLYTLSFVGAFILLMAIINFINITISRSSVRMREIGIRKVMGGVRTQLIFQFLTESFILVFIATLMALVGYTFCRPIFSQLIDKEIPPLSLFPVYYIFIPIGIAFIVGLLSGLYPAVVLSSLKSVDSLKGKLTTVKENIFLRKSLIGFQFTLAIVVLVAAFIVTQQVAYFFSQRLGYDKEYIVSAQAPRDWTREGVKKMLATRNEFGSLSQVSNVTLSFEIPDGNNAGSTQIYKYGSDSTATSFVQLLRTDENYLATYQIPLKAGSFFESGGQDSGSVVINEKTAGLLGYKNASDIIGLQIRVPGDPTIFTVKGVTTDFTFGSMQQPIAPIMFFNVRFSPLYRFLSFKIKPGNIATTIESIQKKWSQLLPGSSFEYTFMDDSLKKIYATEIRLKKAAYTSTVLAFIIVILGVLGLVSLSVQKRTKEIGIRKVLGSSVKSIVVLFMKDFLAVILIGGLVSCPLAYMIMEAWLDDYAYRIPITPGPFIVSILVLGLLTATLVTLQTRKAANANPVKSLRTE